MDENITLMIRINWIWHSQLHITADMRLQHWALHPNPRFVRTSHIRKTLYAIGFGTQKYKPSWIT